MGTRSRQDLDRMVSRLRELGTLEAQPAWGRASGDLPHLGAKLADAVLQSGVRYEVFVRPRVKRIAADFPAGETASGFLALLLSEGAGQVLDLRGGRKPLTIVGLTQYLVDHAVETTLDLRNWLQVSGNPGMLHVVHGVGPKTVSFLKLLVGLDAVAVDIHVRRFVREAGILLEDPEHIELVLTEAGRELGLSGAEVDQLVWRFIAARSPK